MKISVCSDLHLEFGELEIHNTDNTDVLVLAGDICVIYDLFEYTTEEDAIGYVKYRSQRFHEFFQQACKEWKQVIYIMGNHEHYNGDIDNTLATARERLGYLNNLHILERSSILIEDVRFICGTLWTDMNQGDVETLDRVRGFMNDFSSIKDSRALIHFRDESGTFRTRAGKFTPEQSVVEHKAMLDLIKEQAAHSYQNIVVVGHHAPTKQSTHPRFKKETVINGAYSSDLESVILANPKIKLWIHGHTHDDFDYMIGSCRVVCNPRGYIGHERRAEGYQPRTIEVSNL
jgi:predicted phosphodiesterase